MNDHDDNKAVKSIIGAPTIKQRVGVNKAILRFITPMWFTAVLWLTIIAWLTLIVYGFIDITKNKKVLTKAA